MTDKLLFFNDPSIWTKNDSYRESCGKGTDYNTVFSGNGSGRRIVTSLIQLPRTMMTIWVNPGFQVAYLAFDANQKYTRVFKNWHDVNGSEEIDFGNDAAYGVFVLRRGNGSPALLPEDVSDAGLYWGGVDIYDSRP